MSIQGNPNHPKAGTTIKVDPIKEIRHIKAIKKLLQDKPRDLALFVLGINTNLRAGDLVSLKVSQIKDLKPGDDLELVEQKTGKPKRINLNGSCIDAITKLLSSTSLKDSDCLFKGQRGCITPIYVNHLMKKWARIVNLKGNYGSHSLRKTWGYHQRINYGTDIPTLMVCFNHSSQKQTLDYLCIQPEEIKSVYENVIG